MAATHECEQAMIGAFNGLADVVDFLHVLCMAIDSEEGVSPFGALATVANAAHGKATAAHASARVALDLCKAGGRHA